jgi:hypothetical protein
VVKGKEFTQAFFDEYREKVVRNLRVYTAEGRDGPITLERNGRDHDGGYIVPLEAMQAADVLLGYGIADDNSFEQMFSKKFKKPSYGFDCGVTKSPASTPLYTFVPECISCTDSLYANQQDDAEKNNFKVASFGQHIKRFGLTNKKIFLKMDIEGAEYEAFKDILAYHRQITGVVLEIHLFNTKHLLEAAFLLESLSKDFVLVHMHPNNNAVPIGFQTKNARGIVPGAIELTYIHKSLVSRFYMSKNQKFPTSLDQPCNKNAPEPQMEIFDASPPAQGSVE